MQQILEVNIENMMKGEKWQITQGKTKLMSEWRDATWGDLATLEYGRALRGYQNQTGPYRVYGTNGPIGYHTEYLYEGPSVIVGRKGAYRGIHYAPDPFFVIDTAFYLKPKVPLDLRWAYYELLTHNINDLDSGSAIPSTCRKTFYALPVKVPSLDEQRAIAAVLGALDDKIESNRRMNETLEAMARAIFRDWFVDFGPTRAKMEGREPYLAPEIWNLFPDLLDDEGKPEGWEDRPVSDFATIKGGKQLSKENITAHGPVPVFGGAGLMGYTAVHNADGYVISVGRVGAYCGRFFAYRGKAWINNNASLITPKDSIPGEWLLLALQELDIDLIKKGAAQPFVSNSDISAMKVVYPGERVLAAFQNTIIDLMLFRERNEIESRTLAQIRDLLLPKLMSGEIRVREAEKQVGKQI